MKLLGFRLIKSVFVVETGGDETLDEELVDEVHDKEDRNERS